MSKTDKNLLPPTNRGVRNFPLQSVSSRIDWLTATTQSDDIGLQWLTKYRTRADNEGLLQQEHSFKGFTGMGTDGFTWMYNPTTGWYMVILSSGTAAQYWRDIAPKSTNITRIDLAVTVLGVTPYEELIGDTYSAIDDENKRQRKYALLVSSDSGATLYVGSRYSMNYGRLYDKGVESGEYKPGNLFRYEVEIKKPASYNVAMELAHKIRRGEHQESMVLNYVYHWFYTRGVEPVFEADMNYVSPDIQARISTKDSQLAWLRTSVRPTVQRLLEAGFGKDVVEALELLKYKQLGLFDND